MAAEKRHGSSDEESITHPPSPKRVNQSFNAATEPVKTDVAPHITTGDPSAGQGQQGHEGQPESLEQKRQLGQLEQSEQPLSQAASRSASHHGSQSGDHLMNHPTDLGLSELPPIDADLVISNFSVPVAGTAVTTTHSNEHTADKQVKAYAKLSGRDWTYYVQKLDVVIGRTAADAPMNVDIDLAPSKVVSRRHAIIRYNLVSRSWEVEIVGRNGIRLDGLLLRDGYTSNLSSGNIIDVGGVQMMFVLPDAEPQIAPIYIQKTQEAMSRAIARNLKPKVPDATTGGAGIVHPYPKGITIVPRNQVSFQDYLTQDLSLEEYKDVKPPFSYATMISQAILSTPEHMMTLADIYQWISSHYAFYKYSKPGWQNSIRHNLSLNKAFQKVARKENEPGKGSKWHIVDAYKQDLMRKAMQGRPPRDYSAGRVPVSITNPTMCPVTTEPAPVRAVSQRSRSGHEDQPSDQIQDQLQDPNQNQNPNTTHNATHNPDPIEVNNGQHPPHPPHPVQHDPKHSFHNNQVPPPNDMNMQAPIPNQFDPSKLPPNYQMHMAMQGQYPMQPYPFMPPYVPYFPHMNQVGPMGQMMPMFPINGNVQPGAPSPGSPGQHPQAGTSPTQGYAEPHNDVNENENQNQNQNDQDMKPRNDENEHPTNTSGLPNTSVDQNVKDEMDRSSNMSGSIRSNANVFLPNTMHSQSNDFQTPAKAGTGPRDLNETPLLNSGIRLPPLASGPLESSPALWKYMNLESTPNNQDNEVYERTSRESADKDSSSQDPAPLQIPQASRNQLETTQGSIQGHEHEQGHEQGHAQGHAQGSIHVSIQKGTSQGPQPAPETVERDQNQDPPTATANIPNNPSKSPESTKVTEKESEFKPEHNPESDQTKSYEPTQDQPKDDRGPASSPPNDVARSVSSVSIANNTA